jgi:hypothetical protein
MAGDKARSLDNVGAVSADLQASYAALMTLSSGDLSVHMVPPETIQQHVTQEAAIDGLVAGDDGVTPGMKSVLRRAANASLSQWTVSRSRFDMAMQPYMEKIRAAREHDARKAEIERKATDQVGAIVKQAETHRPYLDKKEAKEKAKQYFVELLAREGGRPVVTFGHTWIYLVIMLAITAVEWLVNYDSLLAWTRIPAVAAGFTIMIALTVAAVAHVHGTYLKQRNSRFGPASEQKGRDIFLLVLTIFGLIVVLAVVAWARYKSAVSGIGGQGEPNILGNEIPVQADPLTDVYFSLGINMMVWFVGLIIAFFAHDENHALMGAELENWWRTRRFNKAHKPWEKRIKLERAKVEKELRENEQKKSLDMRETEDVRNKLQQVESQQAALFRGLANELQGAMEIYRMTLGSELAKRGHHIVIRGKAVSGNDYKQMSLHLDGNGLQSLLS